MTPYLGKYDDDEKTIAWGLGYKHHGDKRHRSGVRFEGITYRDGDKREGKTRSIEVDRRVVWSVKHDNRLVQNDETRSSKVMTYDETYNKIRTFSSFDLLNRFSASAQGEIAGIGGSVSNTTETHLHTELETEIFNKQKTERIIDTSARICYPGPLYRDDKDSNGVVYRPDAGRGRSDLAGRAPRRHDAHDHADHAVGHLGLPGSSLISTIGPETTASCRAASTRTRLRSPGSTS